jgi:hypothetical protein
MFDLLDEADVFEQMLIWQLTQNGRATSFLTTLFEL